MSDTSDVKVLTLNTKTVFNTSAAIERVKIHNNSSFFVRVYFGADAPTDPTNGAGWHDTIDPGATPLMEVVGNSAQTFANRSYVQSTPYQGVITLMPFLPVGALTSAGGVVTGAALAYLTGYYPGEWAQEGGEIEAYVQAAKQARYQVAGLGAVVASPQILITEATVGSDVTLLSASMGLLNSPLVQANAAGQSVVNMYLYGMLLSLRGKSPAVNGVRFQPAFALTNSINTVDRATAFLPSLDTYAHAPNFGSFERTIYLPYPIIVQFSIPQGQLAVSDHVNFRYQLLETYGNFDMRVGFLYLLDTVNQSILWALQSFPAVASPPWNAQYNPQTY